jgi:hypothetical protein
MSILRLIPVRPGRVVALAAGWVVVVAIGAGAFFAAVDSEPDFDPQAVLAFSSQLAIACAMATAAALGAGGKRALALEVALGAALAALAVSIVLHVFMWVSPWPVRSSMDYWHFLRLQRAVESSAERVIMFHAPVGVIAGVALGTVAGLLAVLARRRPRLATCLALGLLFASGAEAVQRSALLFVGILGWAFGLRTMSWELVNNRGTATGAAFGAITGALIAGLCLRPTRAASRSSSPATTAATGPVPPGEAGRAAAG